MPKNVDSKLLVTVGDKDIGFLAARNGCQQLLLQPVHACAVDGLKGIGLVHNLYDGLVRAGLYFGKIIRRSKTAGKNQQECPLQIKLFFLRLRILILSPLAFVAAKEA